MKLPCGIRAEPLRTLPGSSAPKFPNGQRTVGMHSGADKRIPGTSLQRNVSTAGRAHNLLLRVLVGAEQVDCLHVAEVDVVAQQEDEQQLADILLLAVAVQGLVPFELGADIGQLLINALDLRFFALTCGEGAGERETRKDNKSKGQWANQGEKGVSRIRSHPCNENTTLARTLLILNLKLTGITNMDPTVFLLQNACWPSATSKNNTSSPKQYPLAHKKHPSQNPNLKNM